MKNNKNARSKGYFPHKNLKLRTKTNNPKQWMKHLQNLKVMNIYTTKFLRRGSKRKESVTARFMMVYYNLFLTIDRWFCHVQTSRKIERTEPTDVQSITSHLGIGFGNRPVREAHFLALIKENKKQKKKHRSTKKLNSSPWPNLIQMRSSTMHIASESQQNAPTFFTGFLLSLIMFHEKIKNKN